MQPVGLAPGLTYLITLELFGVEKQPPPVGALSFQRRVDACAAKSVVYAHVIAFLYIVRCKLGEPKTTGVIRRHKKRYGVSDASGCRQNLRLLSVTRGTDRSQTYGVVGAIGEAVTDRDWRARCACGGPATVICLVLIVGNRRAVVVGLGKRNGELAVAGCGNQVSRGARGQGWRCLKVKCRAIYLDVINVGDVAVVAIVVLDPNFVDVITAYDFQPVSKCAGRFFAVCGHPIVGECRIDQINLY